jgi:hypothetical protein
VNRHCERSEAIHRSTKRKHGLLRRFAPRNDEKSRGCPERVADIAAFDDDAAKQHGDPREALKRCVSGRYGFVPQ